MKMKRTLALCLTLVICASLAIGGTMAYLQDTDSDVNVMTMGSVYIEQHEKDEAGNPFQNQPMYPAVYEGNEPAEDNEGVVDKHVTVENTGKSEAYVRTIFAFEHDADGMIHIRHNDSENSNWNWQNVGTMEIEGVKYDIAVATYAEPLAAGDTTDESLKQIYMDKKANNEHVEAFGDAYEVLVLSQAVQTAGFADMENAFAQAFGDVTAENLNKWFKAEGNVPVTMVSTEEELRAALAAGGNVVLEDDIELDADKTIQVAAGAVATLDLNGYTLAGESNETGKNRDMFDVRGELTVKNGTVTMKHTGADMEWNNSINMFNITAGGVLNVENAVIENKGGSSMNFAVHMNNWGEVTLNAKNAAFTAPYCAIRVFNSGYDMNNVNLTDCTVTAANRAIWVHNYTAADFGSEEKAAAAAERLNFNFKNTAINSRILYGFTDSESDYTNEATVVNDADKLVEALEANKDVYLMNDIKINPANMSNAYGATGLNVKNGQTIDGAGHTLDIKGAGGTWDSGISTTGGTIKNITITGSFRGIFINHNSSHAERVVLENVTIDGTTYTISCDQGKNQGLTATNSTFNGWTSYAATIGDVKFVDCHFGYGNGYKFCRPYAPTEFVNCEFEEGYTVDPRAAVTFENCTLDGQPLTAENLSELVTASRIENATVK